MLPLPPGHVAGSRLVRGDLVLKSEEECLRDLFTRTLLGDEEKLLSGEKFVGRGAEESPKGTDQKMFQPGLKRQQP